MDLENAKRQLAWLEHQYPQSQDHAIAAMKWLIAEVERLQRRVDIWKGQATKYQQAEEWQIELRKQAEDALTRSKAEGRREAFEEAARIAEEWRGTMSMFLHAEDCRAHNTACGQIAAAIRQQAVLEGKE